MSKSLRMGMCSIFALSMLTTTAFANTSSHAGHTPSGHAPIGVSGDHIMDAGKYMVGYKYENTSFSGNKEGTNSVSPASVMARYGDVPLNMTMEMHMFEIMYGATEDLTLMIMPQYMDMRMLHASSHGGGHMHTHKVEGFGDTELTGLYSFHNSSIGNIKQKAHVNFGASLPTGKSNEKFLGHHGDIYNLPYNMQFGSGTFDSIIGATYTGSASDVSWGAQTINYIRMGKNNEGYRQGNKFTGTAWIARNITHFAALSFRVEGEAWEDVSGRDRTLPLTAISGANPKGQAGERILSHVGLNFLGNAKLANQRLALEFGVPLYERFDSPLPKTDYRLKAGWQLAF